VGKGGDPPSPRQKILKPPLVTCPMYPEDFIRDGVVAPSVLPYFRL